MIDFEKDMLLGKAEIIRPDSKENRKRIDHILCGLCDTRKMKVYDNLLLLKDDLADHVILKIYKTPRISKSVIEKCEGLLERNDLYNAYAGDERDDSGPQVLYHMFTKNSEIELYPVIKGGLGMDTKVFMKIKDMDFAVADSRIRAEELLNLLSNGTIRVGIYDFNPTGNGGYSISLYEIEMMDDFVEMEIKNREKRHEAIRKRLKKIKPSHEKSAYISLKDKETAKKEFLILSEDEMRAFQACIAEFRGEIAKSLIIKYVDTFKNYKDRIETLDVLIQSLREMFDYLKANEKKIEKDRKDNIQKYYMKGREYVPEFSDYTVYLKDFNAKCSAFSKWVDEWHELAKEEKTKKKSRPNTETPHYQAAMKLAKRLEKIWFVSEVTLFGSVAKGLEKEGSDIDIDCKIGFDPRLFTPSRMDALAKIIKAEVGEVERNYPDLVKKQLDKKYGKDAKYREYMEVQLFNSMCVQMQSKKGRKIYDATDFFDGNITLLKRDGFDVDYNGSHKWMRYDEIDYIILPISGYGYSYVVKKVKEDQKNVYLKFIKFNYNKWPEKFRDKGISYEESVYRVESIRTMTVNKIKGVNEYNMDFDCDPRLKKNLSACEKSNKDVWQLAEDIYQGGFRRINPDVNYMEELFSTKQKRKN